MSRPVFSPDAATAYVVTDVAGDGPTGEYSFLYAIDVTAGGGGTGTPAAPSSLVATGISASQVGLAWTDTTNNETGFATERCTGKRCTAFAVVGQVGPNVTSYVNTGLSARTQYRYRVRAFNAAGSSAYSNVATARTLR
jgi:titin